MGARGKALDRVAVLDRAGNTRIWCDSRGVFEGFRTAWDVPIRGTPQYILSQKLKACKEALKIWNKATFGMVEDSLLQCKQNLQDTQEALQLNPFDDQLITKEKDNCRKYLQAMKCEESLIRQKSRENWLTLGDSNTKFFYASIASRRARNHIKKFKDDQGNALSQSFPAKGVLTKLAKIALRSTVWWRERCLGLAAAQVLFFSSGVFVVGYDIIDYGLCSHDYHCSSFLPLTIIYNLCRYGLL
ncbi:hypothetical protein Taro_039013 [Colocasia esculenta]|uniref:Uncharacterized protein n=1 Tax=Colocasia esculenta TaxID=4460 RepID=A0A843W875_COLES|nr:hypothetical protein [Colocasia esculenta]